MVSKIFKIIYTGLLLLATLPAIAQQGAILVSGVVLDKDTREPLAFITVQFEGIASGGTVTDSLGRFRFRSHQAAGSLRLSAVGYQTINFPFNSATALNLAIFLSSDPNSLQEVTISSKRKRYRNKNNPAVEFIRMVIARKDSNNARTTDDYGFKKYEKLTMSLALAKDKASQSWILRKYPFLKTGMDSSGIAGKSLVPVYLDEKSTWNAVEKQKATKPIFLGQNQSRIDQYLDEDGFDEFLEKIYGEPDLYDVDITLGNRRFLSPIAQTAPLFYQYYLQDTIKNVQPHLIKVNVVPRNKEDALLTGFLYVTLDGSYAVKRADFTINEKANINWLNDLKLSVEYRTETAGRYYLSRSTMSMLLGVFKEGIGVFGQKTYISDGFVQGGNYPYALESHVKNEGAAAGGIDRPEQLSAIDQQALNNVDSLKNSRSFRKSMALSAFFISGYAPLRTFEFGPFSSFYSFNAVEGSRLKVGARTSGLFNRRVVLDGYLAYGTRDHRTKYGLGMTVSLTDSSIYRFPVRAVSVRYNSDIRIPGQELSFLTEDNILLSFRRGSNNKMWYNQKFQFEYLHETTGHLAFRLGYRNQRIAPAGILVFESASQNNTRQKVDQLTTSEIYSELRWAPHETFFQGKRYRRPIINSYPVYTLRAAVGIKGLLGGQYNYQRFTINVSKRFFLSQLGFSDVTAEAGIVLGSLPFPLLTIHRANQSYSNQLQSYNLMNNLEFVSNRYASLHIQHSFNGFFFNKIPLIKKLKLREMLTVKLLSGTLDKSSLPGYNSHLMLLPSTPDGNRLSGSLGHIPYIEGGLGVSNIFKFLRVDLVRRFTYLKSRSDVSEWGIRMKLNIDF
ncbi:DUF5686 family protein [Dyadobacter sp. 32]|uniref:DUF5686 and carboxypeptidase-like regulatory domain-containing protein n=1 Tax=Dyadobacter sp. 32 TaxID=538966 RepID=UPI0039C68BFF